MINPPEEFSDYWQLEEYFRKYGGAIRHSIRGSFETAQVRVIDDVRQSVHDFRYETEDGKMKIKRGPVPTKYKMILEAPEPVHTVGEEPSKLVKIPEEQELETDSPKPEKPIPKELKQKKSKSP